MVNVGGCQLEALPALFFVYLLYSMRMCAFNLHFFSFLHNSEKGPLSHLRRKLFFSPLKKEVSR